ncbi:Thiol:disulfide oxidoreductase related to ResA [hydrothermal vent metagenome]|uniref:Thiol:disulfide oxidoreductase related to ResA n=1 Tax=hydrothermal vent metagenome TaxID=652676 RepID=A0A3B0YJA2_9ZZZZ
MNQNSFINRISLSTLLIVAFIFVHTDFLYAENQNAYGLPKQLKLFKAPGFSLKGEDGKTYRLSDFRGKLVIINFWATWCPPCRYEMPAMERAWKKLKGKGVMLLAINVGEDENTLFEFMAKYPMSFPVLMDRKGEVIKQYKVTGLPTTYIIDQKGVVIHRAMGGRLWDHPKLVKKLLNLAK